MSQKLLGEVDGSQPRTEVGYPQAKSPEEDSTAVTDTTKTVQRKTRGRQLKDGKNSQTQQQGKGKSSTRKRRSRDAEIRVRQQNKEAAIRCRRRQGEKEADLLSRERSLEDANRRLAPYCTLLREEVFHVKEQLLQHSNCNCTLIQEYITNEAKKSVGRL